MGMLNEFCKGLSRNGKQKSVFSVVLIFLHHEEALFSRTGGSLLSKTEVPGSSLLGHLPKEFSLRLTWCPWLVGYYDTRGISRGARKLGRTPSLSKKKKLCFVFFHLHLDSPLDKLNK